ncbi:hypothetical protein SCHPADRAFT_935292 [Schizopora paradoxa]|uniref:MYND-type domain-containing protein n=1 Tax=Schizopora paradoxa TaxID=27342 RepID=A0A0H2SR10_9AGAM|nr:hypothetical protein SCHPADRAFT_935292 [Schizopora paradoxa]
MTEPTPPSSLPSSQSNVDLSLDNLIVALVSFFAEKSLEHRHCAKYLFGCLEKIRGHEGWLAELQQSNHDFWKGLIKFISSPRKDEDILSLDQGLSDCHCDLKDAVVKHLHEVQLSETFTVTTDPTPFHALISKLLETLYDCLLKVDYIQLCSAIRSNPLALWPTLTSDLLPFGGEVAVKAFLQWAELYNLPIAHAALSRVLMCTRSLVRPYLLENKRFRPSLLERFAPINQPTSATLTLTQKKELADLLDDVLECLGTAVEYEEEWIGVDAPKFITLTTNALHLTFPKSEFAKSNFQDGPASGFANLILILQHRTNSSMMNNMANNTNVHREDHIEVQRLMARSFPGGTPEQRYFTVLCKIHQFRVARQECSALGCGVKAEQMEDSVLRLCSGCRCVAYCSEKCQLTEWKSPMFAHKKACKTFRVFMPYVEELKDGIIRKTAKKCVEDGVPTIVAMNAEFFLGLMERHREEFTL